MAKSRNVKAWHVSVVEGYRTIERKTFFEVAVAKKYEEEMKEKYPQYQVIKENY